MPGFIASLFANPAFQTALGSIGTGLVNHWSARSLSNNAFRQNVNMWNLQNQYNSPASQVARLTAAGLSPALAYGGSSQVVGNSDSPPQIDYSGVFQQPLIQPDAVMQAQQALNLESDRALKQSQIEKNAAETIESINRGKLSGAESDFSKEFAVEKLLGMKLMNDKGFKELELTDQAIKNAIATRNLTKEQIYALELANELNDRAMEARVASFGLQNWESIERTREISKLVSKHDKEMEVLSETARQLRISNGFLPAQLSTDLGKAFVTISSMQKDMEQVDATIDLLHKQTGIAEKELKNWFWKNMFMPAYSSATSDFTRLAGAGAFYFK